MSPGDEAPPPEQIREGILFPNLDKLSKEWRVFLTHESEEWQARVDRLNQLLEELRAEVQRLRGVTMTIDRDE